MPCQFLHDTRVEDQLPINHCCDSSNKLSYIGKRIFQQEGFSLRSPLDEFLYKSQVIITRYHYYCGFWPPLQNLESRTNTIQSGHEHIDYCDIES